MANPNNNQKRIPPKEREAINEGISKKAEQNEFDKLSIRQAELKIFERAKENLPIVLEERINEIELALSEELKNEKGLVSARIHQLISRQTSYSGNNMIGYSPKELFIVFNAYKELVEKINRHHLFVPSVKNFCAFAGFSSITYKNHLQSTDDEKRNVAQMVDDYISDMLLDASKMRRTDAATSIFVAKAEHQMAEAVNPITVQHQGQINLDQVFNRIDQIKKGNIIDGEFKEK